MKILTTTPDPKITANNHLIEMSIGEYAEIGAEILRNNDLQRRRVKTSNRTYRLLKEDFKFGCVIRPIVLAIFPRDKQKNEDLSGKDSLIGKIEKSESRPYNSLTGYNARTRLLIF